MKASATIQVDPGEPYGTYCSGYNEHTPAVLIREQ